MGETKNVDPVEAIENETVKGRDIATKCRWKVQVLKEMFEAKGDQDPIQFEDHVSCFWGVKTICSEIIDQLLEVEEATLAINKNAEICSLDPEKVKRRDEDLRSVGINPATRRPLYETESASADAKTEPVVAQELLER